VPLAGAVVLLPLPLGELLRVPPVEALVVRRSKLPARRRRCRRRRRCGRRRLVPTKHHPSAPSPPPLTSLFLSSHTSQKRNSFFYVTLPAARIQDMNVDPKIKSDSDLYLNPYRTWYSAYCNLITRDFCLTSYEHH
jgi:hypothetical protein